MVGWAIQLLERGVGSVILGFFGLAALLGLTAPSASSVAVGVWVRIEGAEEGNVIRRLFSERREVIRLRLICKVWCGYEAYLSSWCQSPS